jgi:hypothetical protein
MLLIAVDMRKKLPSALIYHAKRKISSLISSS